MHPVVQSRRNIYSSAYAFHVRRQLSSAIVVSVMGGRHTVALRLVQVHQFGFWNVSFGIDCIQSASCWCNSATQSPCVLLDAPSGSVSAQHVFPGLCFSCQDAVFFFCYACIRHGGRHAVALRLVQVHQFGFSIVRFGIGCIRSASFWCNSGTRSPCVLLDAPSGSVSAQHAFFTQCHCIIAPLSFAGVCLPCWASHGGT